MESTLAVRDFAPRIQKPPGAQTPFPNLPGPISNLQSASDRHYYAAVLCLASVVLTLRAQGDLVSRREIVKIRGMYRHRHRGRGLAVLALGLVILGLGHMRLVRVIETRLSFEILKRVKFITNRGGRRTPRSSRRGAVFAPLAPLLAPRLHWPRRIPEATHESS